MDKDEQDEAVKKFHDFVEQKCSTGGRGTTFEFPLKEFEEQTGLITSGLRRYFFHNVFEMFPFGEDGAWLDYSESKGYIVIKKE